MMYSQTQSSEPPLLVPAGKIRCYVHHNVLRKDTPEEHVRQRVARSLVEEYGYAKTHLHIEFPIKVGSARKAVDIAIFSPGAEHKQEHIFAIVEAKREDIRPNDREEGIGQLKSYMAACINARWGLWVGSEMQAFEKETEAKKATRTPFLEATDLPLRGEAEPKRKRWSDLVPATDGLSSIFKRCHNYVHVNGHLGKEKAFFELLKLIFCKVHDEQETSGVMEFSIAQDERRSELGQRKLETRISKLFEAVKQRYPYIFAANEMIELDNRSLAYIVSELEKYNFQETSNDIKGEAYEEIVSVTSRRDQGAFFTPRNVCDMAVRMLLATYPPEKRLQLRILDPACGTGGFLRAALLHIKEIVAEQTLRKRRGEGAKAQNEIHERVRRLCDSNLFGIDKLAELVRAAQMNLAMHGDGSSNVYATNSLLPPGEWPDNVRSRVKPNQFDLVFTNPPFGSKLPVDDPHVLDQFALASFEARNPRSSMPPEQLFIERCLTLLKPGGRMAIVLPDSILSNPGLAFIRRWVLQNAYIIASVDLPRETFARSDTHTMTRVLLLQKFIDEEKRVVSEMGRSPEYEIFMAIPDHVGWDLRGNPVLLRTPEGAEIHRRVTRKVSSRDATGNVIDRTEEVDESIVDDELPAVARLFEEWLREETSQRWRA